MASHERHGVSNTQQLECYCHRVFMLTATRYQSSALLALCEGNSSAPALVCYETITINCFLQKIRNLYAKIYEINYGDVLHLLSIKQTQRCDINIWHYNNVTIASQITGNLTVVSTACSGQRQGNTKAQHCWFFVRENTGDLTGAFTDKT